MTAFLRHLCCFIGAPAANRAAAADPATPSRPLAILDDFEPVLPRKTDEDYSLVQAAVSAGVTFTESSLPNARPILVSQPPLASSNDCTTMPAELPRLDGGQRPHTPQSGGHDLVRVPTEPTAGSPATAAASRGPYPTDGPTTTSPVVSVLLAPGPQPRLRNLHSPGGGASPRSRASSPRAAPPRHLQLRECSTTLLGRSNSNMSNASASSSYYSPFSGCTASASEALATAEGPAAGTAEDKSAAATDDAMAGVDEFNSPAAGPPRHRQVAMSAISHRWPSGALEAPISAMTFFGAAAARLIAGGEVGTASPSPGVASVVMSSGATARNYLVTSMSEPPVWTSGNGEAAAAAILAIAAEAVAGGEAAVAPAATAAAGGPPPATGDAAGLAFVESGDSSWSNALEPPDCAGGGGDKDVGVGGGGGTGGAGGAGGAGDAGSGDGDGYFGGHVQRGSGRAPDVDGAAAMATSSAAAAAAGPAAVEVATTHVCDSGRAAQREQGGGQRGLGGDQHGSRLARGRHSQRTASSPGMAAASRVAGSSTAATRAAGQGGEGLAGPEPSAAAAAAAAAAADAAAGAGLDPEGGSSVWAAGGSAASTAASGGRTGPVVYGASGSGRVHGNSQVAWLQMQMHYFGGSLAGGGQQQQQSMLAAPRLPLHHLSSLNVAKMSREVSALTWIGQGGGGAVFQGVWQGARVAVKFLLATDPAHVDATALEAIVSLSVAHPNVVHTYCAEVTRLSEASMAAVDGGGTREMLSLEGAADTMDEATMALYRAVMDTPPSACEAAARAAGGSGSAPSAPAGAVAGGAPGAAAGGRALSSIVPCALQSVFESNEGFGEPDLGSNHRAWAVRHVLSYLKAKPGMHLTHIVMEHCDRGSLLAAIKRGVFRTNDEQAASGGAVGGRGGGGGGGGDDGDGDGDGSAAGAAASGAGSWSGSTRTSPLPPPTPRTHTHTDADADTRGPASVPEAPPLPLFSRRVVLRAMLRTARDIAQGMSHLHANDIIHGDLKPGNVLLRGCRTDRRGFIAMVADFGLSKLTRGDQPLALDHWSTVTVMAPETIQGSWQKASDVYSFGILLWQLVTSEINPYGKCTVGQILYGVSQGTLAPRWPSDAHPAMVRLGRACLAANPTERPSFEAIAKVLTKIETSVRNELRNK